MGDALLAPGALETALQQHFGLSSFRPLQREIIAEAMGGRPLLAVLPTGGGKSLCYQLPALMLPGATLVISPLISLMKDQVDALVLRGVPAIAINSQDTAAEGRQKLEALASGQVKLAYVAPERLKNPAFLAACARASISLLAVDEAHCISQWGHDFRPDYRYIRDFHAAIGAPPLLALTATAKPEVRQDIMAQLGIDGAQTFLASADRDNLWLGLETCATVAEKRAKVAHLAGASGGSTIIYVSSRKDAETWAGALTEQLGEPVAYYHAGLAPAGRTAVQNQFMTDLCRVVVATNAFGMGIDKPDIRAVIHAGVPDSLEAYFQEVGRAGRDGLPAACTMVLVGSMDVKLREYLLGREETADGDVDAVFRRVAALAPLGGGALYTGEDGGSLSVLVVSHLQALGAVELVQRSAEGLELRVPGPLSGAVLAEVRRRLQEHSRQRQQRFATMRRFVYLKDRCRREYLLHYFGEALQQRPAACCSACHPRPLPELAPVAPRSKRPGRATAPAALSSTPAVAGAAPALVERLKQWRRAKAAEMKVPAYVVFGDRDLEGIAAAAPVTLAALAACRGIGPAKLQQYGEEVLEQIRAAAQAADAAGESPQTPATPRLSKVDMVAHTAALFAQGQTVEAVAAALGRAPSTVWGYFLDWLAADQSGAWKQAVRQVITPDDYRAIRQALLEQEDGRLAPVHERLEGRYTFEQLRVARTVIARSS